MNPELRNWYLRNLELPQYLSKTKFIKKINTPASINKEADVGLNVKQSIKEATLEKNTKNKLIPSVEAEISQFKLSCWQPVKELIIFNEMSPKISPHNDLFVLLSNILSSIGCLPNNFPEATIIDLQSGEWQVQVIEKKLLNFIQNRITKENKCLILLMGKTAFDLLSPSDLTYTDCLGKKITISEEYKALVLHSLQDNLKNSQKKLETWNAIKSLTKNKILAC
jgi:hypothetical protein